MCTRLRSQTHTRTQAHTNIYQQAAVKIDGIIYFRKFSAAKLKCQVNGIKGSNKPSSPSSPSPSSFKMVAGCVHFDVANSDI